MTNSNRLDISISSFVANNSKSTQTTDGDNTSRVTKDTRPQPFTRYPPTTKPVAGQFLCSDLPPHIQLLDWVREAAQSDPFYQVMINAVDKRRAINAQLEQAKLQGEIGMVEDTWKRPPDDTKGNMESSKETFVEEIKRVMADIKKNRERSQG